MWGEEGTASRRCGFENGGGQEGGGGREGGGVERVRGGQEGGGTRGWREERVEG